MEGELTARQDLHGAFEILRHARDRADGQQLANGIRELGLFDVRQDLRVEVAGEEESILVACGVDPGQVSARQVGGFGQAGRLGAGDEVGQVGTLHHGLDLREREVVFAEEVLDLSDVDVRCADHGQALGDGLDADVSEAEGLVETRELGVEAGVGFADERAVGGIAGQDQAVGDFRMQGC